MSADQQQIYLKFLFVIPARKGSKGISRKNLYCLGNKTLIERAIDSCNEFPFTHREINMEPNYRITHETIVSTDDRFIQSIADEKKLLLDKRPKKLCDDHTTLNKVMLHILKHQPNYDYYVCLQPTSPFRDSQNVWEAIEKIIYDEADSLISVKKEEKSIWRKEGRYARPLIERIKNRNEIKESELTYIANGAIFITSKRILEKTQNRLGGRVSLYEMNHVESLDINNWDDLELAEFLEQTKPNVREEK